MSPSVRKVTDQKGFSVTHDEYDQIKSEREIRDVIHRWSRAVDRCDRDMLLSTYHPDGWDDHGGFRGTPEEFGDWVMAYHLSLIATSHYITNILITQDGDRAKAESYCWCNLHYREGDQLYDLFGNGRYLDDFERRNGEWKIFTRTVLVDVTRVVPVNLHEASGTATDELVGALIMGKRSKEDLSYAHFKGKA
jgi:ketosteroid isomerase-like protein